MEKFFQCGNDDILEKKDIPSFFVYLNKEDCLKYSYCMESDLIRVDENDVENPTIIANEDALALWAFNNLDTSIATEESPIGHAYKVFCLGNQSVIVAKSDIEKSIFLSYYEGTFYSYEELMNNNRIGAEIDILTYKYNDSLFLS